MLLIVLVLKEYLARRISVLSRRSGSCALEGDAWHHRCDALTSAAAATGISIALIGGPAYASADDWGALVACILIVINAARILLHSFHENIDGRVDNQIDRTIRLCSTEFEDVRDIEKCRIRKSGSFYFAEVHVQIDPDCTKAVGHEIAHQFKARLSQNIPNLQEIVTHIEPYTPDHSRQNQNQASTHDLPDP